VELTAGIVVADRFRLVRPLGQGGMGAVWLAHHIGLDVPCALKFIHEGAARSPEVRARFELEARAAARLRSPNVVQILDHGVWQGSPYIAMELLEGEDLAQRIERCRVIPPRDALAIVSQVGRALGKAHAAGLIHRDLKPANIFLARDDDHETAKVLDFGVAKNTAGTLTDSKTKTGALVGTPYYMSPEQARGGRDVDSRADLWSLAVITFQCIVGRLPFYSEGLGDLLMRIIAEPLPVPSQLGRVPAGFDAWWARAAAREPAQRFQSARELTDALTMALGFSMPALDFDSFVAAPSLDSVAAASAGLPASISAQTASPVTSPSVAEPATPRRHSAAVLAAVGVSVALVCGGGVFVVLTHGGASPAVNTDAPSAATAKAPAAEVAPSAAPVASASGASRDPQAGSSAPSAAPSTTATTTKLPAPRTLAVPPSRPPGSKPKKPVHDDGV
jgi:serine/threonine protein kinase